MRSVDFLVKLFVFDFFAMIWEVFAIIISSIDEHVQLQNQSKIGPGELLSELDILCRYHQALALIILD